MAFDKSLYVLEINTWNVCCVNGKVLHDNTNCIGVVNVRNKIRKSRQIFDLVMKQQSFIPLSIGIQG